MCSDAATVTANSLMTCPDACYQAPRSRVPSVVVLGVEGSSPIACFTEGGTRGLKVPKTRKCSGAVAMRHIRQGMRPIVV